MNRRGFLGGAIAAVLGWLLPATASQSSVVTVEELAGSPLLTAELAIYRRDSYGVRSVSLTRIPWHDMRAGDIILVPDLRQTWQVAGFPSVTEDGGDPVAVDYSKRW